MFKFSKKILAVTMAIGITTSLIFSFGCGEEELPPVRAHEFFYQMKEDGTYDICGMAYGDNEQIAHLEIPAQYNGIDVTSISSLEDENGNSHIYTCQMTLPKTIKSIAADTFAYFEYNTLSDKKVPSSIDDNVVFKFIYTGTVDDWLQIDFENEKSNPLYQMKVTFPNAGSYSWELPPQNKFYCDDGTGAIKELTKLELAVEKIDAYRFAGFNWLEEITLTGTKIIEKKAFAECYRLKKLTMDVVETIGIGSFEYCNALETVDVGTKLKKIEGGAFWLAYELSTFVLPETIKYLGSDIFGSSYVSMDVTVIFPKGSLWIKCPLNAYETGQYNTRDARMYAGEEDNFVEENGHALYRSYVWIKVN